MALKPCRECGAQVSTNARVCPSCGRRSPTLSPVLAFLGFALLLPLVGFGALPVIVAAVIWSYRVIGETIIH